MPILDIPAAIKRHETTAVIAGSLLLILLLACFLRCDRLTLPPLNNDEAFSWRLTTYSIPELIRHLPGDAQPPLYYLVLKGWTTLFGDSPLALRGLSIVFALASVVVIYALCREAAARLPCAAKPSFTSVSGELFSALLLAVHQDQSYEPSRTARMYSQGIFLGGLTAWLLLRALRCSRGCLGWWLGYGLAVTAFCYTQYYAFFTVAAQTLFVAGDLAVRAIKKSTASIRSPLMGFALAGCLAFLLYVPWLPVWWKQTHDVWQGFWIGPTTMEHIKEVFFRWSSGLPSYHPLEFRFWTLFLIACIVWIVYKADRGGLFLLVQATVPWALGLALSAWTGRSIFLERYLLFAQLFLFAFWGIVWDRLSGVFPRLGLGSFIFALNISGFVSARDRWPTHPPVLATAAAFLRDHSQDGDVVLTGGPSTLNLLRYYTTQAGHSTIPVRCAISPFLTPGHVGHVSSLQAEDILWTGLSSEMYVARRFWALGGTSSVTPPPGEHWREVSQWSFGGGNEGHYYLILYERS